MKPTIQNRAAMSMLMMSASRRDARSRRRTRGTYRQRRQGAARGAARPSGSRAGWRRGEERGPRALGEAAGEAEGGRGLWGEGSARAHSSRVGKEPAIRSTLRSKTESSGKQAEVLHVEQQGAEETSASAEKETKS